MGCQLIVSWRPGLLVAMEALRKGGVHSPACSCGEGGEPPSPSPFPLHHMHHALPSPHPLLSLLACREAVVGQQLLYGEHITTPKSSSWCRASMSTPTD